MDSNTVLGKIMHLLSLNSVEDTKLTYAKLADGTILESPTFEVGEPVELVSEDGTKTSAPDGESEIELMSKDETLRFKIVTEGGVVKERTSTELQEQGDVKEEISAETETVEEKTEELEATEQLEEEVTEESDDEVTINLEDVAKQVEEMAYRIDELEKKLEMQEEETIEETMEEDEDEEMLEAKKLDGAPVEASKLSKVSNGKQSYHQTVLSRMYN